MTPTKKKAAGKAAKKTASKPTKGASKRTAKPVKKATKKASVKKATKKAAKAPGKSTTKAAKAPRKGLSAGKADAGPCAATTTRGTPCAFKSKAGSQYCARHQDFQPSSAKSDAAVETMSLSELEAEQLHGGRQQADAAADGADGGDTPDDKDVPVEGEVDDEEMVLYGSVYSTTLEASPYDDMATTMAEGEEDVDLIDERDMGRSHRGPGQRGGGRRDGRGGGRGGDRPRPERPTRDRNQEQPPQPRMTRDEAAAKARETIGPRPDIAPEEDIDGKLDAYDQRLENEIRKIMGGGRRRRGRRGGRKRRSRDRSSGGGGGRSGGSGGGDGGGSGSGGGGGDGGGGPRGGRRGGGRRRGGRGPRSGGGGSSTRSGPSPAARKNIARDSPLAAKRPSRGPKRGVQPRRRRDPEV